MKGPMKFILTIAEIILIVVIAAGFFAYSRKSMEPETIYVYSRTMNANTILKDEDIVSKQIPKKAVTESMIKNKEDIIGKAVFTTVFAGEYVIDKHIIDKSDVDIFKGMDLGSYRTISIEADLSAGTSSSKSFSRGQKVDLVYLGEFSVSSNYNEYDEEEEKKFRTEEFAYSTTFLQGVLVYDVVDENGVTYNKTEGEGELDETTETVENKKSFIILAVTLAQYEEIVVRQRTGDVFVVGRLEGSTDVKTKGYSYGDSYPIKQGPNSIEIE